MSFKIDSNGLFHLSYKPPVKREDYYFPRENELKKIAKYDSYYMDLAIRASKMSYCDRKQVGAVGVINNKIISDGWNGQPTGIDNCCEDENNVTMPSVLHAEANLISKISKSHESSNGITVYCTLSCCIDCAKIMYQAGVSKYVYLDDYRSSDGLDFLKSLGVEVKKINA